MTADAPSESTDAPPPRKTSISLLTFIGFFLGIAAGLFFGDFCAPLESVGTAFIGLLQMTIYPYIAVSIISNIGKLSTSQASRLARQGMIIMALLWGIGIVMLLVMPLSFPDWTTAAFFSKTRLEPPAQIDYLDLFIPSNPFASFADGAVPAMVVFCICVGIALIGLDKKSRLLEQLDILMNTLAKINAFIIKLMPIGIFVITAAAAGTLSIDELARLEAYLITYTVAVLFLTFWVLPMLIVCLTPFSYRQVLRASRDALITALVTGKLIIVLPFLIEGTRQLLERYSSKDEPIGSEVQLLYPLAYPFPNLGKLMTALFIPFSAWFLGEPIPPENYPGFLAASLLNMFANVLVGVETLLRMMHLPHDMLHLFVISGVYSSRVGELLGVMHLVTFVILVIGGRAGLMRIQFKRLLLFLGISLALLFALIEGSRFYLGRSVKDSYTRDKVLLKMQLLEESTTAKVLTETAPNPVTLRPGQSYVDRIRERGWIRVGFNPDNLPYSFFNSKKILVGFDIEMAHHLAADLKVNLELVPFDPARLTEQLHQDCFDVVMSGVPITMKLAEAALLSDPYLEVNLSLVVPDHNIRSFQDPNQLRRASGLRIAHRGEVGQRFRQRISKVLNNPKLIEIAKYEEFFSEKNNKFDALLIDAESGFAWTILYPHFKVVLPKDMKTGFPLTYPVGGRDEALEELINNWIRLNKMDGTLDRIYDHWILGKLVEEKRRRWCIIRDVLHWVD